MIKKSVFAIASGGTASDYQTGNGARLVGLLIPAMDSTTITFDFDPNADGVGAFTLKTNTHGAAPVALNLGTADTGGRAVAVPEEVGRMFAVCHGRIVVAAQNGGARQITAFWMRDTP